jgi:phytanoyl-CoA hydroxylase
MAGLSSTQREQFEAEGYLVVEDVLDPERDIAPVMEEYAGVLDGIAQSLYREGAIRSTYADLPFDQRLIQVCVESGRNFPQHFDFSLPQTGVDHDTPIHVGPAVFGLLTSERLLDVAESILGPEIYSNPTQHIRMKLPHRAVSKQGPYNGLVSKIPWHQDNGVLLPEADEASILTIWMPITPATVDNGCLQVIPRSHRGDLLAHCPTTQGVAIPEKLLPGREAIPLPMQPGSILLMTQRTVHSSLDNITDDQVRISFDLRYQPTGQPTGRPMFPGFIARSQRHPEAVLRNPAEWARLWYEARARLAEHANPSFNRWTKEAAVCA